MQQFFKIGDRVRFNPNYTEVFLKETTNVSDEITQYQKLVIAGLNQVGIIKEVGIDMTTVSFEDGWDLPLPTKYLSLLPG